LRARALRCSVLHGGSLPPVGSCFLAEPILGRPGNRRYSTFSFNANSLFGFGIDHTYDLGARWKTTSIAGATEQQSFDTLGRLSGVSLNGTSLALYNYGASGVGGPLWIDYSTGAHTAFTYDARNRQTDFAVQENGATLLSLHTALGADGIPRERVHSFNGHTVTNAFPGGSLRPRHRREPRRGQRDPAHRRRHQRSSRALDAGGAPAGARTASTPTQTGRAGTTARPAPTRQRSTPATHTPRSPAASPSTTPPTTR